MKRHFGLLIVIVLLSSMLIPPLAAQEAMPDDERQEALNRMVYIGWIEELSREQNADLWDMFIAEDYVLHRASGDTNSEQERDSYVNFFTATLLPDLNVPYYTTLADGDIIASPQVISATCNEYTGGTTPYCGWYGVDFVRVRDGQIVEQWDMTYDTLHAARQWGNAPYVEQPLPDASMVPIRAESALTEDETEALVQRASYDLFMGGNIELAEELLAPELIVHPPLSLYPEPLDLQGYMDFITTYQNAFPSFTLTPREEIAPMGLVIDDNLVAFLYNFNGAFTGEILGMTPTNRQVQFTGVIVYRIFEGKIAEIWLNWDTFGASNQMG